MVGSLDRIKVVCVHLAACPSPLLRIRLPINLGTIGMLWVIWRAGGGCYSPYVLL